MSRGDFWIFGKLPKRMKSYFFFGPFSFTTTALFFDVSSALRGLVLCLMTTWFCTPLERAPSLLQPLVNNCFLATLVPQIPSSELVELELEPPLSLEIPKKEKSENVKIFVKNIKIHNFISILWLEKKLVKTQNSLPKLTLTTTTTRIFKKNQENKKCQIFKFLKARNVIFLFCRNYINIFAFWQQSKESNYNLK